MTNLVEFITNQSKTENQDESNTPAEANESTKETVDPELARRRVVSETLGEIKRKKTSDKNRVQLMASGQVVGEAVATYKTKTQRTWSVTVCGVTVQNQHTINKGLRQIEEALSRKDIDQENPKNTSVDDATNSESISTTNDAAGLGTTSGSTNTAQSKSLPWAIVDSEGRIVDTYPTRAKARKNKQSDQKVTKTASLN